MHLHVNIFILDRVNGVIFWELLNVEDNEHKNYLDKDRKYYSKLSG